MTAQNSQVPTQQEQNQEQEPSVIDILQLKNGDTVHIRPLEIGDYDKGFGELLHQLADTLPMTREQFDKRYKLLTGQLAPGYYLIVAENLNTGWIVASGTLVIEYKFIKQCTQKGHIEDVVVDKSMRGQGLGLRMVELLKEEAMRRGCTPVVLSCKDVNVPFYEKIEFKRNVSNHMRWVPEQKKSPPT